MNFHLDRALKSRSITLKALAQSAVQLWVAGFPNFVARVDSREVEITVAEEQRGFAIGHSAFRSAHFIDPPAFLLLVGMSCIEHHSVAGLEWSLKLHEDLFALNSRDITQKHSTLLTKTRVDQMLMVDAADPARIEGARTSHL